MEEQVEAMVNPLEEDGDWEVYYYHEDDSFTQSETHSQREEPETQSVYLPGTRRNTAVFYDGRGYYYHRDNEKGKRRHLRCVRYGQGCRARAAMDRPLGSPIALSKKSPLHNHAPNNTTRHVKEYRQRIRERSRRERVPLQTILQEESLRYPEATGNTSFRNLMRAMQRARNSDLGSERRERKFALVRCRQRELQAAGLASTEEGAPSTSGAEQSGGGLQNKQFKTEGPEVTDGSQQSRRSKKATSSDPDDAPPCKVPRLAKANETSGNVESTNRQQRRSSAVQYKESESEESVDCPGVEQTDYPLPAQVKAEPEYVAVAGQFEVVNLPSAGQLADEELFNNSVDAISTPQNQLCRLCVKNEGLVPLFQRSGAPRVLAIQAMTVTRVKVSSKDGLPARICRRCEDLLQQSFHFKLQCEVADVTLRSKVAARAVAPEVLSTAKADAFCLLTDQLDKTLTKLNCIVSSLKKLESKDRYSAPAPDRDTAPVGGVDVKVDAPSSPSGSGVEIKTEMEFEEHLSQSEPCIDSTSGSEEQTDGLLSSEELPPEKTEVPGTQPEMPVMQTSQEESGSSRLRERLQPSEPPSSAQLPGEHGTVRPGLQVKDVSSLRSALVGNPPNLSSAEVGGRIIPQLVKLGDGSVRLYHVYVPDPPPLPAPGDGQPGPLVPKGAARGRSKQLSRVQTLQAAQAAVQAAAQHTPTIVVQAPRGRGKNTVPTSTQIRAQKRKPWRVLTELISDPLQISESLRTQTLVHESSSPLIAQASAEASDPLRTQELTHESSPLIAQALAEASDPLRTQELTHEIDRLRMQASAQPCKLPDTHGLSKSSEPFVTKKLFEPSETHKEKPLEQTDELVKRDALTENEQCSTQDLVETVTVKFCEHTTDKIMS